MAIENALASCNTVPVAGHTAHGWPEDVPVTFNTVLVAVEDVLVTCHTVLVVWPTALVTSQDVLAASHTVLVASNTVHAQESVQQTVSKRAIATQIRLKAHFIIGDLLHL